MLAFLGRFGSFWAVSAYFFGSPWVIMGGFGLFWVVLSLFWIVSAYFLGGFGWLWMVFRSFWVVPSFSKYTLNTVECYVSNSLKTNNAVRINQTIKEF